MRAKVCSRCGGYKEIFATNKREFRQILNEEIGIGLTFGDLRVLYEQWKRDGYIPCPVCG